VPPVTTAFFPANFDMLCSIDADGTHGPRQPCYRSRTIGRPASTSGWKYLAAVDPQADATWTGGAAAADNPRQELKPMHTHQQNNHAAAGNTQQPLHLGLRVELSTTSPGQLELPALAEHRLKIHAGPPVRGACSVHRFLYTRGDIDIQPAGYSDAWQEFQPNTSLIVHLSRGLLRRAAEDLALDPDRAVLEPQHQFRDPQIEHIAWALEADRRSAQRNGDLYTESLGLALAVHLLCRYRPRAALQHASMHSRERGLSPLQLRRVIAFIEEHLDQDLSIARLAGLAAISGSHFKTLFKRSVGVPVHEYVIQRRVEHASALLSQGDLPASEIALAAGFAHQSHMARAMRRVLGVTPRAVGPDRR
jgi:AraC family transcriptional regulator